MRRVIQHLAIDVIGLNVYGEGEWQVKKYGTGGKRGIWRKLHITVDTNTHEIIVFGRSLSTVIGGELRQNLRKQIRRSLCELTGNGAYERRACYATIKIKRAFVF